MITSVPTFEANMRVSHATQGNFLSVRVSFLFFWQFQFGLCDGNNMKIESASTPLPRFNKCCFLFGLRSGVLIYVSIEALFWAVLSFAAVFSEVKYINSFDLLDFTDDLDRDWYYYLIFEHPRDTFNERVRSEFVDCDGKQLAIMISISLPANLIVLNLVLIFIFVFYLAFTLLLLIGISRVSLCCLIKSRLLLMPPLVVLALEMSFHSVPNV